MAKCLLRPTPFDGLFWKDWTAAAVFVVVAFFIVNNREFEWNELFCYEPLSFRICLFEFLLSNFLLENIHSLESLRFADANLPLFQLGSRPHFITPDFRYQMLHSVTIFPPLSFLNCIDSTHIHNIHCLTCLFYTRLYFVIVEWMVFGVLYYSILY